MEIPPARKRPQPVVLCLRCREKKLKCDRLAPCQNCIKVDCRAECTCNRHPSPADPLYQQKRVQLEAHPEHELPAQPDAAFSIGIIEDLQQRLSKLETLLAVRPHNHFQLARNATIQNYGYARPLGAIYSSIDQTSRLENEVPQSSSPFLGTLVVKGSRTRYHGQNDRITLLNQVELQCLMDS